MDHKVSTYLGTHKTKICKITHIDISKLEVEFHVHTNASLLIVGAM